MKLLKIIGENKGISWFIGLLLVISLFIYFNVATYVGLEHPIYYWDYKGYFYSWIYSSQLMQLSPKSWLESLFHSINSSDYNILPIAFLFIFYNLPLDHRTSYILAISLCYLTPVILLLIFIFKQFEEYKSYWWLSFIAILGLSFTPFWSPLFRGYPDIVGLIPILLAILFLLKTNINNNIFIKNILIVGALLWMPFGLRRWYAYTIISLYITLPFFSFFIHRKKENGWFRPFFYTEINFALSAVVSLVLALLFQKELLLRALLTNYSHIYSAYKSDLIESLHITTQFFCPYLMPLFFIGVTWSIFCKKSTSKYLGLFAIINLIVSYTLFFTTQTAGQHHHLPFALWFFILVIIGLNFIVQSIRSLAIRKLLLVATTLSSLLFFGLTFYNSSFKIFDRILPGKAYPLRLENFSNYERLNADIEKLILEGNAVSFIASSSIFNEDIVSAITQYRIDGYLPPKNHVDLRDQLHLENFLTNYVIVGSPVQTHLPSGQHVVTIPAEEFIAGEGISSAYKRQPNKYELANGVRALLFEKTRPFTQQEAIHFFRKFTAIYPDWEKIYLNPIAIAYMTSDVSYGEYSLYRYDNDRNIIVIRNHNGAHQNVEINWDFGDMQELIVVIGNSCDIQDEFIIQLENDVGIQKNIEVNPISETHIDVTEFSHQRGTLSIYSDADLHCENISFILDAK